MMKMSLTRFFTASGIKHNGRRLYVLVKNQLDFILDRLTESCSLVLMDYIYIPVPGLQGLFRRVAFLIGNIALYLRFFPRLDAYRLNGQIWSIVFAGTEAGCREISHLFFDGELQVQPLGRIAIWKFGVESRRWLEQGIDLVIIESSRLGAGKLKAPLVFRVPAWVQQELVPPKNLEAITAGKRFRGYINRFEKLGASYRFSQSEEDFNFFYHCMYLPFIPLRHLERSLITPYKDLLRWFQRGGLIIVNQGGKDLAGMVGYQAGDIFYPIEEGVLDGDNYLWQQGINAYLFWCVIKHGVSNGAKVIDLGGSHSNLSDGSFTNKRRWGGRVARRKRITTMYRFLGSKLSHDLLDRINQSGFLTEEKGKYYQVCVEESPGNDQVVELKEIIF